MNDEDLMRRRDAWSTENCSVAATLDVIGNKSTLLLLREASFGTRRFADFAQRAHLSEPVAAKWLRVLVGQGLLERRGYQEPGQRARDEYVLTEKGRELLPVLTALRQWGDRYAVAGGGPALLARHRNCGGEVHAALRCEAGHDVAYGEVHMVPGPGFIQIAAAAAE